MVIWKGIKGFLALAIIALVDLVLRRHLLESFIPDLQPTLGKTLVTSAVVLLPMAYMDFKDYRRDRVFTQSSFFIPVCLLPIVLVVLGLVYWSAPYQ